MAVTPNQHRPHASVLWPPDQQQPQQQQGLPIPQPFLPPMGVAVASSLPTALMKPNVIAAAAESSSGGGPEHPPTLWALREKWVCSEA